MAKYEITYRCGHAGMVDIQGPVKDRSRKAEWESRKDCPECFRTRREAERIHAAAKSAADNAQAGLPTLSGSEKQVAWAEQIRAEMQSGLRDLRTQLERVRATAQPQQVSALESAIARIEGETRAVWWIDHQAYTVANLVRGIMQGVIA